jgi:hypothetical protein
MPIFFNLLHNYSGLAVLYTPGSFSFFQLHLVINYAFGWQNAHLHEFSSPKQKKLLIGDPANAEWDERETTDEYETPVSDFLQQTGDRMVYLYDFGDGWEHDIVVKTLMLVTKNKLDVKLLGAIGACPPEDVGGVYGYEQLKVIMTNPAHKEYKSYSVWLGLGSTKMFNPWDSGFTSLFMDVAKLGKGGKLKG